MKILRRGPLEHQTVDLPRLTRYNPLNPSFVISGSRLSVVYRGCNYNLRQHGYGSKFYGSWGTQLTDSQHYLAELSLDLKLKFVDFIEDRHIRARTEALDGVQDLKLFKWSGKIHAVGSGCNSEAFLRKQAPTRFFRMMMFTIRARHLEWVATFPSEELQEKNWMPWVLNGTLHFVYRPNPFAIVRYEAATKTLTPCRSALYDAPEPQSSGGSCIVPMGEGFMALIHKKEGKREKAAYSHRLVRLSRNMRIESVSEPFTFENERVEYGSGLALAGSDIYLGYGVFDERATILRTDCARLMDWLQWRDCRELAPLQAGRTANVS